MTARAQGTFAGANVSPLQGADAERRLQPPVDHPSVIARARSARSLG